MASKSVEFLQQFCPNGPWRVGAISLNKEEKPAFLHCTTDQQLEEFIKKYNGKANLYFTINKVRNTKHTKPNKIDIEQGEWLHVDIDSNATTPDELANDKTQILNSLGEGLPKGLPKPTIILFSGNGYWALWKLKTPVKINNTAEIENFEKYNIYLSSILKGDHCHNIDRIARIPYTMNIPTEAKKKKGRVEVEASVVVINDNIYEINEFKTRHRCTDQ